MSEEIESQWTNEGFNRRFEQLIKEHLTYVEAYRQAEEEHVKKFGKLRYKSYESFRGCRHILIFNSK